MPQARAPHEALRCPQLQYDHPWSHSQYVQDTYVPDLPLIQHGAQGAVEES